MVFANNKYPTRIVDTMLLQTERLSENQIIPLLQKNNPLVWEGLYDKYAPAMFGLICNLTDDKKLAEEIFTNAFLQLKQRQILLKIKYALYPALLRYTYSFTTNHLKKIGINTKTLKLPEGTELIHLLTTQCNSLSQAAFFLKISLPDAKEKLFTEFLSLQKHECSFKKKN